MNSLNNDIPHVQLELVDSEFQIVKNAIESRETNHLINVIDLFINDFKKVWEQAITPTDKGHLITKFLQLAIFLRKNDSETQSFLKNIEDKIIRLVKHITPFIADINDSKAILPVKKTEEIYAENNHFSFISFDDYLFQKIEKDLEGKSNYRERIEIYSNELVGNAKVANLPPFLQAHFHLKNNSSLTVRQKHLFEEYKKSLFNPFLFTGKSKYDSPTGSWSIYNGPFITLDETNALLIGLLKDECITTDIAKIFSFEKQLGINLLGITPSLHPTESELQTYNNLFVLADDHAILGEFPLPTFIEGNNYSLRKKAFLNLLEINFGRTITKNIVDKISNTNLDLDFLTSFIEQSFSFIQLKNMQYEDICILSYLVNLSKDTTFPDPMTIIKSLVQLDLLTLIETPPHSSFLENINLQDIYNDNHFALTTRFELKDKLINELFEYIYYYSLKFYLANDLSLKDKCEQLIELAQTFIDRFLESYDKKQMQYIESAPDQIKILNYEFYLSFQRECERRLEKFRLDIERFANLEEKGSHLIEKILILKTFFNLSRTEEQKKKINELLLISFHETSIQNNELEAYQKYGLLFEETFDKKDKAMGAKL